MRKLRKSKKATVLLITIAFGFLIVSIFLATQSDYIGDKDLRGANALPDYIGQIQSEFIEAESDAKEAYFAADQIAKHSLFSSIFDLGEKGGHSNTVFIYADKNHGTYSVWRTASQDNYPKRSVVFRSLGEIMNKKLKDRMQTYFVKKIPDHNFEFLIETPEVNSIKLTGIAVVSLEFNVFAEKGSIIGRYVVKPSFTLNYNYKINDYQELTKNAEEIVADCANKINHDLKRLCINNKVSNFNSKNSDLKWVMSETENENMFLFDIEQTKQEIIFYDEKPVIKFALYVPHVVPKAEEPKIPIVSEPDLPPPSQIS